MNGLQQEQQCGARFGTAGASSPFYLDRLDQFVEQERLPEYHRIGSRIASREARPEHRAAGRTTLAVAAELPAGARVTLTVDLYED
ncbi:hypothetical protein [Kitasatospora sp. NBC_01266]|uniref:hypothetical protein n=1 Tax=Kitasatospora sp. NBC_01266 TaxID=2903572 RepID=UPI002E3403F8|nr:hypothetical protein [Kitasatospora sp. NBC_01266]